MKSVVIVGAGGFAREVLEIFKAHNKISKDYDILGFVDDDTELHGKVINNCPVLGGLDWIKEHSDGYSLGCVCAIGTPETRKRVVERLQDIGIDFCNAIHPSVIICDFVELGQDVIIQAGSILAVNSKIGDHVHINFDATIGHDAIIGSYCTIAPGAHINGEDHFGQGVDVGTGATFLQQVSIGSWSTIGAGAVVTTDIPEKVVAVGVPAKVIKKKQ